MVNCFFFRSTRIAAPYARVHPVQIIKVGVGVPVRHRILSWTYGNLAWIPRFICVGIARRWSILISVGYMNGGAGACQRKTPLKRFLRVTLQLRLRRIINRWQPGRATDLRGRWRRWQRTHEIVDLETKIGFDPCVSYSHSDRFEVRFEAGTIRIA